MNLLEGAKVARNYLNDIGYKGFAKEFVLIRGNFFKKYHNDLIISNSHGINYFDNVVKYWENPISYVEKLTQKDIDNYSKQKYKDDYEKNFVLILIENKKSNEK